MKKGVDKQHLFLYYMSSSAAVPTENKITMRGSVW